MIKKLLVCLSLMATTEGFSQPAAWSRKVNHYGAERAGAMAYIPDSAHIEAALWTYTIGEVPPSPGGSSSSSFENRLIAFRESNGAILFNKLVNWGSISTIAYDSSSNDILVLLYGVSNNPLARVSIGTDTFKILPDYNPATSAAPCNKYALVRYSRSGTLKGYSLLDYPCREEDKLDYSFGTVSAISTRQNKIALSFQAYGKLFPPVNTVTFGTQSRQVAADSAYITVFEWDFDGHPLRMNLFAQPRDFSLKSALTEMAYDEAGNIFIAGELKSGIDFETMTLSPDADVNAAFLARIRPDGVVTAARKIQPGPNGGVINDMVFNSLNQQLYITGNWRHHMSLDGSRVYNNIDSSWLCSGYIAALDSALAIKQLAVLRDGDTVNATWGSMQLTELAVDLRGHILATGGFRDSLYVGDSLFRALSVSGGELRDVMVMDFTGSLELDTIYLSEGSGSEVAHKIVAGKEKEMYIGGSFSGTASFPPYNLESYTSPASWVVDGFYTRLKWADNPVAVSGLPAAPSAVLYPNPAAAYVRIELPHIRQVVAYMPDGRVREQVSFPAGTSAYTMHTGAWLPGMYLIQVVDINGNVHRHKLLKK